MLEVSALLTIVSVSPTSYSLYISIVMSFQFFHIALIFLTDSRYSSPLIFLQSPFR